MKPAVLAVAAVAALAAPVALVPANLAHAGCAGGPGGSSGSSGSGWYLRAGPECRDATDVVGLRRCRRFGAWGRNLAYPYLILEGGAMIQRFPTLLGNQLGSVTHGAESFAYRVVQRSGARPRDTAVLSTLRASVGLSRALYGGIEVDLGGVTRSAEGSAEMTSTGVFGSPELRLQHSLVVDSLGVVGLHGSAGLAGFGVELAGGLRAVSYSFHSSYHDCQQSTSVTALAAVGEARVRGELWLGPWFTAGATVGTSVLTRGAYMAGVYLGVHSRAFGGGR
jgi:hypothetical protein